MKFYVSTHSRSTAIYVSTYLVLLNIGFRADNHGEAFWKFSTVEITPKAFRTLSEHLRATCGDLKCGKLSDTL